MTLGLLRQFRLVGGTSLSLQFGHRESVDIDLFTDEAYGSVDFLSIEKELKNNFPYVKGDFKVDNGLGVPCFIGNSENDAVKLDLFYTDPFVFPLVEYDHIRMAAPEEIAAMKLEVVGRGGRKKDFWDLHELLARFTLTELLNFYFTRYPFSYSENELLQKLVDFSEADNDFNPKCFQQKYWELIRLDFEGLVSKYQL